MNSAVEFWKRLGNNVVTADGIDDVADKLKDIDIFIINADDFLREVARLGNRGNRAWGELEKIAADHSVTGLDWYLSDLSEMAEYFSRVAAGKDIITFFKKIVDKYFSGSKATSLYKMAETINSEEDFRYVCRSIGIEGSDLKARTLRGILAGAVKESKGIEVGRDLDIEDFRFSIESNKSKIGEIFATAFDSFDVKNKREDDSMGLEDTKDKVLNKIYNKLSGKIRRLAREDARKILKDLSLNARKKVFIQLASIDNKFVIKYGSEYVSHGDSSKLIQKLEKVADEETILKVKEIVKEHEAVKEVEESRSAEKTELKTDIKYGEEVLVPKGSVGEVLEKGDDSWTVMFDDYGIITTSDVKDFSDVTEENVNRKYYVTKFSWLEDEGKKILKNGYCPLCKEELREGKRGGAECNVCGLRVEGIRRKKADDKKEELEGLIGIGSAVRIEGDPASKWYGQVGLVEKILDDGWVGVNLRDKNYIERFMEDLAPVSKVEYNKDQKEILTKDQKGNEELVKGK